VTRADRVAAVVLLVFAAAFSAGALKYYAYSSEDGPGPGFLPFWLGLIMAALAALLLMRHAPASAASEGWLPSGEGRRRVLVVLGATLAFVALIKVLGMVLAAALYLAFLMRYLGRQRWWLTLLVAAAVAGADWLVFAHWLHVPFPEAIWTF
jgi:hypothetical protein